VDSTLSRYSPMLGCWIASLSRSSNRPSALLRIICSYSTRQTQARELGEATCRRFDQKSTISSST